MANAPISQTQIITNTGIYAKPTSALDIPIDGGEDTLTLIAVTLSAPSYAENLPAGTVIASIGGGTSGSTVELLTDAGGRIAMSGSNIVIGSVNTNYETTPTVSISLRQSKAGYSDLDQVFSLTVANVSEGGGTPVLGVVTVSGSLVIGTATTGSILGTTASSTLVSNVSGLTVNSAARTYIWSGNGTAATSANGIVETLAGATGSPKSNPITVVAQGSTVGIPQKPAGYIDEITTFAAAPAKNPQWFTDLQVAEMNDPNNHPHLPTDVAAVKSGDFHDPTVWAGGAIPTANQSFDVGNFNVIISQSCEFNDHHVGGSGSLRFKPANPGVTQLVITARSLMNHGTSICGTFAEPIPFMTNGQPGVKIVIKPRAVDGVTTEGGIMNMGAARWIGVEHEQEVYCLNDLAVGQKIIPVVGIDTANWPIGAELTIPGTAYLPLTTDPTYTGATSFLPSYGGEPATTADYGYMGNTAETVILKAKTASTITVEYPDGSGLKYVHQNMTRTHAKTGMVNHIIVPVIMASKPWEVVSQDPSARWKRFSFMQMINPDFVYSGGRLRNGGRTAVDLTLKDPEGPTLRYAADGVTVLTDPTNVRGRYGAIHVHMTGWEKMGVIDNCYGGEDLDRPAGPGWVFSQHLADTSIRRCSAVNFRAAGFVSEMGGETGDWTDLNAVAIRGDGFGKGADTRAEQWKNQNGHYGVGFENQSRNILNIGLHAWQCNVAMSWLQQDVASKKYNIQRMAPMQFQRYYDPLAWNVGGAGFDFGGGLFNTEDGYGTEQAQIPPSRDCSAVGCREGIYIEHRWNFTVRAADEMGMWHNFNCFNTSRPVNVPNYTGKYVWLDSAWVNGNIGAVFGNVSSAFSIGRTVIDNFVSGISTSDWNYDGFFWDIDFRNVTNQINSTIINVDTTNAAWLADTKWDTMEPRTILSPTQAKIRTGKNLNSSTDLPQMFPAAPIGAGGVDPIPGKTRPYMYVDPTSTLVIDYNSSNPIIKGMIVDSVGTRLLGDMQSSESGYVGVYGKGGVRSNYAGQAKPAAYYVQQFGCFQDAGVWKCRLWFSINDRGAPVDTPVVLQPVDYTLLNFPAQMLADNTRDPALTAPAPAHIPEWPTLTEYSVPAPKPVSIVTSASHSWPEAVKIFIWLQADTPFAKWSLTGADAALWEIVTVGGKYGLRLLNDSVGNYTAKPTHNISVTATEPFGGTATKALTVTLVDKETAVVANFSEAFGFTGNLGDNVNWTRFGAQETITVNGSSARSTGGAKDRVVYVSPNVGDVKTRIAYNTVGWADIALASSITDINNFIKAFHNGNNLAYTQSIVGGVIVEEFSFPITFTSGEKFGVDFNGENKKFVLNINDVAVASGVITQPPPITTRVGLCTGLEGGSTVGYDNFSAKVLPPIVAPAITTAPAISGEAKVGKLLYCPTGVWANSPTEYAYQWKAGTTNVGTNNSLYNPTAADAGKLITCVVTATNDGGSNSSTSAATASIASATATWTPSDIDAKLRYWLDAMSDGNKTDGSVTTSLANKKSGAAAIAQTNAALRVPFVRSSGLGANLPAFKAASDKELTGLSNPFNYFYYAKDQGLIGFGGGGSAGTGYPITGNAPMLAAVHWTNGSPVNHRSNGTAGPTTTANTGGEPSGSGALFFVATSYNANPLANGSAILRSGDGEFGEWIVFNQTLTLDEVQKVEGYLAWKWGIQTSLAAGHPYKSAAPAPSTGAGATTPLRIALAGSSTPDQFATTGTGTSNARVSKSTNGTTYNTATSGAFVMECGNLLANALNRDVRWLTFGGSGSSVAEWLSGGSGYTACCNAIIAAGGVDILFYQCGFNDAGSKTVASQAGHAAKLRQLFANFRTAVGQPNLKIMLGLSQRGNPISHDATAMAQMVLVRAAEQEVAKDVNNSLGYNPMDLETADGTHQTVASQLISATRLAPAFMAVLAGTTVYNGPIATSATAVDATHTDITFTNLHGSNINPATAITGVTMRLSDASVPTIVSAARQATNVVRITHSSLAGLAGTVSYLALGFPDVTGIVYDNGTPALPSLPTEAPLAFSASGVPADTTAPTLSSPNDAANGSAAAALSVSTNEANGTLYWYVSTSGTAPSVTNLKAGTGAAKFGTQVVSATGVQNVAATGLTASTAYFAYFLHRDAAGNDSAIASGDGFTTTAAASSNRTARINMMPIGSADVAGYNSWKNNAQTVTPVNPISSLLDTTGAATGWSLATVALGSTSAGTTGATTGNNSGAFPDEVLQTYWYTPANTSLSFRLSNMDNAKQYTLVLLGSRATTRVPQNFVVQGVTKTQDVSNNTSIVSTFANVSPVSGNIDISMSGNSAELAYINVWTVTEQ